MATLALAHLEQLDEPARLFLEPQWFASHGLPAALRQRARDLINLRDRLFVELGESLKSIDKEQAGQPEPIEPVGAALPTLNTAPQLDIPPWQSSAFPPPLPPFSNVPNDPQV